MLKILEKPKTLESSNDTLCRSIPPIFNRASLLIHTTLFNLKESLPYDAELTRLFLGQHNADNLHQFDAPKNPHDVFHLNLFFERRFPIDERVSYKLSLALRFNEKTMKEASSSGPLKFISMMKNQRVAVCETSCDNINYTLTPVPDETDTVRLYLLGNDCNFHSPVLATLILQVR